MPQYETSARTAGISKDGTLTWKIPVSVTDDSAATPPTAPTGTNLVSVDLTSRDDGGRDYVFTYESIAGGWEGTVRKTETDPTCQITGQAAQEPIETHWRFNGGRTGTGTKVSDADLAEIKKALDEGKETPAYKSQSGSSERTLAEELYKLMRRGISHYYTPSGITYSESFEQDQKPDLKELCTISRPSPNAPYLENNSNWLLVGLRAEKNFRPYGNSFWTVTKEWMASGPRGWNADGTIYE